MDIRNSRMLLSRSFVLLLLAIGVAVSGFADWQPARNRGELNRMLDDLQISDNGAWEPGNLVHLRFEIGTEVRQLLKQAGSVDVRHAILSVRYPEAAIQGSPKILFTSVTSDIYAPNAYSIRKYIDAVKGGDWILMSVDPEVWPMRDSVIWRLLLLGEAMRYLQENWADYSRARFAFGGYSGGSKFSVYLAFFSKKIGKAPMGIFMGGCNEAVGDSASEIAGISLDDVETTPLAFSLGTRDRIAKPRDSKRVVQHWQKQGFANTLILEHPQGHVLKPEHVRDSLNWFEQKYPEPGQ